MSLYLAVSFSTVGRELSVVEWLALFVDFSIESLVALHDVALPGCM